MTVHMWESVQCVINTHILEVCGNAVFLNRWKFQSCLSRRLISETPASQDRMVLEDKLMTNKSVHNERKGKAFKTHLRVLRNVLIVFM